MAGAEVWRLLPNLEEQAIRKIRGHDFLQLFTNSFLIRQSSSWSILLVSLNFTLRWRCFILLTRLLANPSLPSAVSLQHRSHKTCLLPFRPIVFSWDAETHETSSIHFSMMKITVSRQLASYSDKKGSAGARSFDITCCDVEPAIIGLHLTFEESLHLSAQCLLVRPTYRQRRFSELFHCLAHIFRSLH